MTQTPEQVAQPAKAEEKSKLFSDELDLYDVRVLDLLIKRWSDKGEVKYYDNQGNDTNPENAKFSEQELYNLSQLWAIACRPLHQDKTPAITIYAASSVELDTKLIFFDHLLHRYHAEVAKHEPTSDEYEMHPYIKQYLWFASLAAHPSITKNKQFSRVVLNYPGLKPQ
ncbi:MAG: hypothetical protein QG639_703 [Patescibacteria group bacterium]|jgi:hypothetical protein|nr:hypothetical protein [Patescibacteria group bacterium]